MSGVRIELLDACDALDVIHYLFEDDIIVSTGEQSEARDSLRRNIYPNLYNVPYTKPNIPLTKFDPDAAQPFGSLLDPPVG